ncbi:YcdB/YcdC domain-containing protein [Mesobacillus jeotgali]|uniref:DUF4901 domain-containing protein n=1 Tax=Mesobacillus jeotgali TaxID=129985 RepID=A0ABY9VHU8_9BACI|nr:YcdB/YcdC domain-containing protein [Mesobacillus jeotgali]WNF23514.1 DUF4901 domain-containing protein [Mesobacillus jeotgali]
MKREKLKARALEIGGIPANYTLLIEDFIEEKEAIFIWVNEYEDSGITVKLDSEGNLTNLILDKKVNVEEGTTAVQKRELAEQFLLHHYPKALQDFSYGFTRRMNHGDRFYYSQFLMDLPMGHTGCYIDVNDSGEITTFSYYGVKPLPAIPENIIAIEALREDVKSKLDFEIEIIHVSDLFLDVEEGLRLVYEPVNGYEKYKATQMIPTYKYQRDEEIPETYERLPEYEQQAGTMSNEEIIGITSDMEIIREVDMGGEIGIVWRGRDWDVPEKGKTMNDFFKQQTESTVKAFISRASGKVIRFAWFYKRNGTLELSREECYEIAVRFLQSVIPEFYPFLQRIVRGDEDQPSEKESFMFRIHTGHDIPVQSEIIMVAVSTRTGLVHHFSGPSLEIGELKKLSTAPKISREEAAQIYLKHLDFQLAWEYDHDEKVHSLIYTPCEKESRKPIRYIDGMTGKIIVEKE